METVEKPTSPIFASILEDRTMGWTTIGAISLQAGLVVMGLPGWQCPVRYYLGVPCPGCGLSRSMEAFLHGDWEASFTIHAFGPFFLLAIGILILVNLLPSNYRLQVIEQVKSFERKTYFTAILLICLVLYWLIRLVFFREFLFRLIVS